MILLQGLNFLSVNATYNDMQVSNRPRHLPSRTMLQIINSSVEATGFANGDRFDLQRYVERPPYPLRYTNTQMHSSNTVRDRHSIFSVYHSWLVLLSFRSEGS